MKFREGASWPGSERARRPFWLHQVAEYVIGAMLIFTGLQSASPVVPAVMGGVVAANAAFARGPLSAFDVVPRRLHKVIDPVIVVAMLLAALLPIFDIDGGTRLVLGGVALVLAFVWWFSSYETAPPRDGRVEVGRTAGRFAAKGVNAWRSRKR